MSSKELNEITKTVFFLRVRVKLLFGITFLSLVLSLCSLDGFGILLGLLVVRL